MTEDDSEMADLAQFSPLGRRILTELRKGTYTCMVCTGDIDYNSRIWSCPECSRVFDLECIQDWAKRGSSTQEDKSWRCPSCNATLHRQPKRFTCWCGKVVEPAANPLVAFSCGQTCGGKMTGGCPHGCLLVCHPGPHAEKCTAMGPALKCHCGREKRQVPCSMTPYTKGWSCEQPCGDLLPCGIHRCKRKCHSGLCGPCETLVEVRCYCGRHTSKIPCCECEPKKSTDDAGEFIGCYECNEPCNTLFDCGVHRCELGCHPQSKQSHICPRGPNVVKTCPCGKCKIADLQETPRQSCTDPIPTCGQICGKVLECGRHHCILPCHDGQCSEGLGPLYGTEEMSCRCGRQKYTVTCDLAQGGYVPVCEHKCIAKLNCRRHVCGRVCCDHEEDALDRERAQARAIRRHELDPSAIDDTNTMEAVHICTQTCNRLLDCGIHRCKAVDHPGKCPQCLELVQGDLVCPCGKTVVYGPYRCGTTLPPCSFPCHRTKECGHPIEPHKCHPDDVECPPCMTLVTRPCQCEKHILMKNVLCSQKVVSCGKVCGKLLSCGLHHCTKICHPEGECPAKCIQVCGKKRSCGHRCRQKCHTPSDCDSPDAAPCKVLVELVCPCGRRHSKVACHVAKVKGQSECDEECLRAERNKKLFAALGMGTKTDESGATPELMTQKLVVDNTYTPFMLNLYARQPVWCNSIEKILFDLVKGKLGRNSYHFSPMRKIQRQFVHELAESYRVFTESQDREPKRSVFAKTEDDSFVPSISLKEASVVIRKLKQVEERRAEQQQTASVMRQRSQTPELDTGYNAVAIRDVFFGVTRDKLEAAVEDLWNNSTVFTTIKDPLLKWVEEGVFVFYSSNYNEHSKVAEAELDTLAEVFEKRLREKSLAMKCCLAKIDEAASVVYEYKGLKQRSAPPPEPDPESLKWY